MSAITRRDAPIGSTRLTPLTLRCAIVAKLLDGEKEEYIGALYGVSRSCVQAVARRDGLPMRAGRGRPRKVVS